LERDQYREARGGGGRPTVWMRHGI
jgi:hypothetical protein